MLDYMYYERRCQEVGRKPQEDSNEEGHYAGRDRKNARRQSFFREQY